MIIHDYEKWTDLLTDTAISTARNMIKKEAKKISKYNRNTTYVDSLNNCDASNNTGNWNHLNIIHKIRKTCP